MQRAASERVKLGENLNPLNDATGVDSINFSADIDDNIKRVSKLKALYDRGEVDSNILRYVLGMNKIMYQGQIDYIDTQKNICSEHLYRYGTNGIYDRING